MVSLKVRLLIFVIVTVTALIVLYLLSPPYPPPAGPDVPHELPVIADTWWGAVLLLLIPASLAWVSFGAKSQKGMSVGFALTLALLAICVLVIRYAYRNPYVFQ